MQSEYRDELRRWANALVERGDDEALRAAGRAITTLCDANVAGDPIDRGELERFAKGLGRSEVAELRAAGRAIRALCAENATLGKKPAAAVEASRPRRRLPRPRPVALPWRWVAAAAGAIAILGGAAAVGARAAAPHLDATGPSQGAAIGPEALASLSFATG